MLGVAPPSFCRFAGRDLDFARMVFYHSVECTDVVIAVLWITFEVAFHLLHALQRATDATDPRVTLVIQFAVRQILLMYVFPDFLSFTISWSLLSLMSI